jgi:hypothetical protein
MVHSGWLVLLALVVHSYLVVLSEVSDSLASNGALVQIRRSQLVDAHRPQINRLISIKMRMATAKETQTKTPHMNDIQSILCGSLRFSGTVGKSGSLVVCGAIKLGGSLR